MRRHMLVIGLVMCLALGCGALTWTAWATQRSMFVLEDARNLQVTNEGFGATAITYNVAASPRAWRFRLGQRLAQAGWASETHTLTGSRSTFVVQLFQRTFRVGAVEVTEYATLVDDSTAPDVVSIRVRYDVQWR